MYDGDVADDDVVAVVAVGDDGDIVLLLCCCCSCRWFRSSTSLNTKACPACLTLLRISKKIKFKISL